MRKFHLHVKRTPTHPVRSYLLFAQGLLDDLKAAPLPSDLITAGSQVELKEDMDWVALIKRRPLQELRKLVQVWNPGCVQQRREGFKWLITENGALLLRVEDPRFDDAVFISSNRAVTHGFLRRAAATSITEYGKVTAVREHLVAHAMGSPNEQGLASNILGTRFLTVLLRRIFQGPTVRSMIDEMKATCGLVFSEFSDLAIDGTVTIMQSVVGNIPEGKSGPRADDQERLCLTVKGRTGCVLTLKPAISEGFDFQHAALLESVPETCRHQVLRISSDDPPKLVCYSDQLRRSFPMLKCVAEDPVHATIRMTKCSGGRSNQVSVLVHSVNMLFFQSPKGEANEEFRWSIDQDEKARGLESFHHAKSSMSEEVAKDFIANAANLHGTVA